MKIDTSRYEAISADKQLTASIGIMLSLVLFQNNYCYSLSCDGKVLELHILKG